MQYGDVFFTTSSETPEEVGMSSVWLENTENIYLNSFCFGYRPTKVFDPYFLAFYLRSPSVRTKITLLAQGISRYNISKTKLMEEEISFPTLPEQQKIGTLFRRLDRLITLHKRKWDDVILLKKALLQKMFPKNGSDFPTLRFPEFTDAWEKCKLGEFVNITTGKLDANAMIENGQYDFYTSGVKKYKINTPAFKGPAITIAGNGATVGFMHLADGEFNAYQRTYVLTEFYHCEREFLFYEIGRKLPKKISSEARAGNIPYIVMDMLTELNITIPSLPEQQKIGALFRRLDRLITLHKRKLLEKYNKNNTKFLQNVTHQQSVLKLCCITFNPIIERTSLCN